MRLGRKPKLTPHQRREAIRRRDSGRAVLADIAQLQRQPQHDLEVVAGRQARGYRTALRVQTWLRKGRPYPVRRDPSPGGEVPFAAEERGVRLAVRLTTRADRNALGGVVPDAGGRPALQVRLTAPPVGGAANEALIGFLAAALGLRKADVRIRSGATARSELLHLSGDGAAIARRLAEWVGTGHG